MPGSLWMFGLGMAKKVLVADVVARGLVDPLWSQAGALDAAEAWLAARRQGSSSSRRPSCSGPPNTWQMRFPRTRLAAALLAALLMLCVLRFAEPSPFVYFQF